MIKNTFPILLGIRDDLVKDGPAILAVTASIWVTWLTFYGIVWVIIHVTACSAG